MAISWRTQATRFSLPLVMLVLAACARPVPSSMLTPPTVDMAAPGPATASIEQAYGRLPLHFEENRGQADSGVLFIAHTATESVLLTSSGLTLAVDGAPVRLSFAGAAAEPAVEATDLLPGQVNYYLGKDPDRWRTGIPTYRRVRYSAVYPGVDVVVYGNQRQLEYDFVVA